jgi:hypothetical protein
MRTGLVILTARAPWHSRFAAHAAGRAGVRCELPGQTLGLAAGCKRGGPDLGLPPARVSRVAQPEACGSP